MTAPNTLLEGDEEWIVTNPKGETLTIAIHEVISDVHHDLGVDPGLRKDGVEAHLQELLAVDPERLGPGMKLIRREFPTEIGPVDLLCRDADNQVVAIEVKRRGEIDGVEQLTRYLDFLNRQPDLSPVKGMFVAQEIKLQAKTLAGDRDIECVEVDYDELRGIERPQQKLF
jgi:RecB family endonuclease NucS